MSTLINQPTKQSRDKTAEGCSQNPKAYLCSASSRDWCIALVAFDKHCFAGS